MICAWSSYVRALFLLMHLPWANILPQSVNLLGSLVVFFFRLFFFHFPERRGKSSTKRARTFPLKDSLSLSIKGRHKAYFIKRLAFYELSVLLE